MLMLTYLSVDERGLPKDISTDFRGLSFNEEIAPIYLKYMNSVLSEFR